MTRAHVNAEFKARCADPREAVRRIRSAGARWAGREHQVDTYFRIAEGRLKVRETRSHSELVWYFRGDGLRSKRSDVVILSLPNPGPVKEALTRALGVKTVVDKVRRIYLRDNVRIHLDEVRGLGRFVEIESVGEAKAFRHLQRQAEEMALILDLHRADLIRGSYGDLLTPRRRRAGGRRR